MVSVQDKNEKKGVFRPVCRCGLKSGMHFKDQCRPLASAAKRQAWEESWGQSQLSGWRQGEKVRQSQEQQLAREASRRERRERQLDREDEFRAWHEKTQAWRGERELLFTGKQSQELKKIKAELQEYHDLQKVVDAGKKMELELWQWRKLGNKHEQNRRKQLEESPLLQMEARGYKVAICREFGSTGSCRFGDACCFRHESCPKLARKDLSKEDKVDASTVASVEDLTSKEQAVPEFNADVFSKDEFPVLVKPTKAVQSEVAKVMQHEVVAETETESEVSDETESESEVSNDKWWSDLAEKPVKLEVVAETKPEPTKAPKLAVESFDAFLASARLESEKALFLENGFDSVDMLLDMSEEDMREIGLKLGHIKKLKAQIAATH